MARRSCPVLRLKSRLVSKMASLNGLAGSALMCAVTAQLKWSSVTPLIRPKTPRWLSGRRRRPTITAARVEMVGVDGNFTATIDTTNSQVVEPPGELTATQRQCVLLA